MTFGGNGARLAQGLGKNPTFRLIRPLLSLEVLIAYISVLASFKLAADRSLNRATNKALALPTADVARAKNQAPSKTAKTPKIPAAKKRQAPIC